jgi:hypothetical protein
MIDVGLPPEVPLPRRQRRHQRHLCPVNRNVVKEVPSGEIRRLSPHLQLFAPAQGQSVAAETMEVHKRLVLPKPAVGKIPSLAAPSEGCRRP